MTPAESESGVAVAKDERGGRTGRRSGSPPTREAILRTANELFRRDGYSATSLRAVARAADVDAALVVHYFGTKAGLLRAALERQLDQPDAAVAEILANGPDAVGERLVRELVDRWDHDEQGQEIVTIMSCSLREPVAGDLLHEMVKARITAPLATALARAGRCEQADLRADLAAAQIIGLAIARQSLKLDSLVARDADELAAVYGPLLQHSLTGALTPA
jgi:AcrR family transcriptional regulator